MSTTLLYPVPYCDDDGVGPEEEHEDDDDEVLGGDLRLGDPSLVNWGEGGGVVFLPRTADRIIEYNAWGW